MPTEADRLAGTPLAYKEAVLLNKGGVDDKYEYSMDKKDLKIKGWISDTANVGNQRREESLPPETGNPVAKSGFGSTGGGSGKVRRWREAEAGGGGMSWRDTQSPLQSRLSTREK
ncbi:hypothetical protein LINPERHAP1_LOCUS35185 [Linum perenne]